MNVLLFVTSLIMVMAMLTYARLESYRSFSMMQTRFKIYMEKTERSYINHMAKTNYNVVVEKRGASEKKNKAEGLSRLSFAPFLDKAKQQKDTFPIYLALAKKLIYILYKDQPFFQDLEKKRPDILDALFSAIEAASSNLPEKKKIKKAKEIANLQLEDDDLNTLTYLMLQGTIDQDAATETKSKSKPPTGLKLQGQPDITEVEDEYIEENPDNANTSPEGYYSLLNFITVKESNKVRVFLAPKYLLLAIYDDPALVKNLMDARNEIYKNILNEKMTPQQATELFKNQFLPPNNSQFNETILDFTVTKTNPKNYE